MLICFAQCWVIVLFCCSVLSVFTLYWKWYVQHVTVAMVSAHWQPLNVYMGATEGVSPV